MRRLELFLVVCVACGAPSEPGVDESGGGTSSGGTSSGTSGVPTTGGSSGAAGMSSGGSGEGSGEGSSSSGAAEGSSSEGGSEGGAFVVDCGTRFDREQRLAFACNIPGGLAECEAIAGAPCEDADLDGLTDAWEDLLLAGMRPLRRFDEGEMLLGDPAAAMGDVGRVVAVGDHVRVYVMLGYHLDYGSCGFTGHNGDSERVVLDLVADPEGGVGGAVVVGAYTAAHENTPTDHGMVFTGAALGDLVFTVDAETGDPRWVVYPSRNKHATYATVEICENISPIPCLDEDCAPDDVDDPAMFDVLPEKFVNAGEEAAPRVTELSVVGFPGDEAWAMQDFCGGLGGSGCSAPVREKLLADPFL